MSRKVKKGPSKRYRLSKKELKMLRKELESLYPAFPAGELRNVEYAKVGDIEFYVIDGIPAFYKGGNERLFPVLLYLLRKGYSWLPRVIVDRGATKAIGRGADLMIPGIRDLDDFNEGSVIVVVDEESKVPVGVGIALISSEEIREKLSGERRGRAIRTIHYPGDPIWEAAKLV